MAGRKKTPIIVSRDRDIQLHLSNPEHLSRIADICKSLSNVSRLNILNILKNSTMSVQEIADTLGLPVSSVALHIKSLEDAGLIVTESQPGLHGSMRVCTCCMQSFYLQTFDADVDSANNVSSLDMPIGNYYSFDITPTCGLADENGVIDSYDNTRVFYLPARATAQLLWFKKGYIEYRFPNISNPLLPVHELEFCMELCSEAPGYLEDWPSDITISINNHEVVTYCAPGDFGSRRGHLTPPAWPNGRTQYGLLKSFSVRNDGAYLDGKKIDSRLTLSDIRIMDLPYITLKIEIKENAKQIGGINLFGEKYGDYPQGIVMNIVYE